MNPTDEQQQAIDLFLTGGSLAIEAGAGCLAATTMIHINRAGKGACVRIDHIAQRLRDQPAAYRGPGYAEWDPAIPTLVARADGATSRLAVLSRAWYSGIKQTYLLTTQGGNSIRATAEHPFLTPDRGWLPLGAMVPGDRVSVNTGRSARGRTAPKANYHSIETRFHPFQTRRSSTRNRWSVPTHRLIIEAEMNGISLDEFIRILREQPYTAPSLTFLDPGTHVHHVDRGTVNNDRMNLAVLSEAEHHRLHAAQGKTIHVLWQIGEDRVLSIRAFGEEPTYDIEVADDPHNFLANDFVVHNTGKTSTLKMLGESAPAKRMQYVAFNKSLVVDAGGKFTPNVTCNTAHSLAFQALGKRYAHRLRDSVRMPSKEVASRLGIEPFETGTFDGGSKILAPGYLAGLVSRAVTSFCQSDSLAIEPRHFGYVEGLDLPTGAPVNNAALREFLLPSASKLWDDLCQLYGWATYKHEHYLKCQPPGTLVRLADGTTRPIGWITEGDLLLGMRRNRSLRRSSGARVTAVRRTIYEGRLVRTTTEDGHLSEYTPEHYAIALIGDALDGKAVVYLMRRGNQYRIGRTPWRYGSQANTLGIVTRARDNDADAVWVLSSHDSTEEAALAEALAQHRYNLPGWTFIERGPTERTSRERFWAAVGSNSEQAARCLAAHGRNIDEPLWSKGGHRLWVRQPVAIAACNLMNGMRLAVVDEAIDQAGMRWLRGNRCWQRITVSHRPYTGEVVSLTVEGENYVGDGILTHNSWQLSNPRIFADVVLFDESQDANPVIAAIIDAQDQAQRVYVGDSQQEIYGWTGAVNALARVKVDHRTFLTQSFRFGQGIADVANEILGALRADLRLRGNPAIHSEVAHLDNPKAILTRTNALGVQKLLDYQSAGEKAHLVGGGADVLSFARAARDLMNTGFTSHPELACFSSWVAVQEYVQQDPNGEDLRLMVRLVDGFGADAIIAGIERMPLEEHADVVISTAHKSKGREWPTVQLGSDFPMDAPSKEALRLLYVSVTRAKEVLDIGALGPRKDAASPAEIGPSALPLLGSGEPPTVERWLCWCGVEMRPTPDVPKTPWGHTGPISMDIGPHPAALKKPVSRSRKKIVDVPHDRDTVVAL
jgi:Intein splicing domain/UvrD-like helicase C-terminal domain/UvrD/REP helicase N-terminal domain